RALIELHTKAIPEQDDTLIVAAGGKSAVSELCLLLEQLGVSWRAVLDWDATEDTNRPILRTGMTVTQKAGVQTLIAQLAPDVESNPMKPSKTKKLLDAMVRELQSPKYVPDFDNSVVGKMVVGLAKLTLGQRAGLKQAIRRKQPVVANKL